MFGDAVLASGKVGNGKVVCTELTRQGYVPAQWLAADLAYQRLYTDAPTRAMYHAWAIPLVWAMRHSSFVTALVRPCGAAWAQHMAYTMGAAQHDSPVGRWLMDVGLPLHRALAQIFLPPQPDPSVLLE